MKQFLVTAPITLHAGIVRLTPEQARGRMHKLEPVKDKKNCYRITGPNQFKAGQEIGFDGDLPKSLAENLTSKAEAEAAAKKAAAEAEKAEKKAAEERAKAEAEERAKKEAAAMAEWDANEPLRKQYEGNRQAYLAEALGQGS